MKKLTLLTLAITSIALVSSCGAKQENLKSNADVQQTADAPTIAAPADAPTVADAPSDAPAEPAPSVDAKPASGDGIFKYTITTDVNDFEIAKLLGQEINNIEILVAMNSVGGKYPVKYDLDCDGDGDFEYKGLADNQKCIYKKNSGKHQIWVRGEIPAMFLCARKLDDVNCGPEVPEEQKNRLCDAPLEKDHSSEGVISIDSWGNVSWKSMKLFASECQALNKLPQDSPDLSQVKDMSWMFALATSFNQPLEAWDVSNVTNMRGMFLAAYSFNQPLEKWDVSNVTDMSTMFGDAFPFNQPLEKWNVSNVTNMKDMFWAARSFNQPLDKWDVSNVNDMSEMFSGAEAFSHYPKNWVVPADKSKDMFTATKVEAEAKKSPLKTK